MRTIRTIRTIRALGGALLAGLGTSAMMPIAPGQVVSAQSVSAAAPLAVGETFTITSRVLGETRRINVYLPSGYRERADARMPVLYMPDGGIAEDFQHVAGLVQVLTGNGGMRPFILVGIENTERRRDMTGPTTNPEDRKIAPRVGGSAAFRRFIRDELFPVVESRYRTTRERAIVGESLAGLFVVETLLLEPSMFDTYIAFDPSLWWNRDAYATSGASLLRDRARQGALAGTLAGRTLYLAHSDEPTIARTTRTLADSVRVAGIAGLTLHFEPMPTETHATIYHPAALRAFRTLLAPAAR